MILLLEIFVLIKIRESVGSTRLELYSPGSTPLEGKGAQGSNERCSSWDHCASGQEKVHFAGLEVIMDGIKPSAKFLDGIRIFPRPESLTDACSFFGMINQVSYPFAMSIVMEPFRLFFKPETWSNG